MKKKKKKKKKSVYYNCYSIYVENNEKLNLKKMREKKIKTSFHFKREKKEKNINYYNVNKHRSIIII